MLPHALLTTFMNTVTSPLRSIRRTERYHDILLHLSRFPTARQFVEKKIVTYLDLKLVTCDCALAHRPFPGLPQPLGGGRPQHTRGGGRRRLILRIFPDLCPDGMIAAGETRRGGGGDSPPIVIPLGLMLLALALLSLVFKKFKQSNIIACIIIGGGVGGLKLHETWQLSRTTMNALIELGITLVLFMGGLEVDIDALRKYLKLTLINGCGQIISHWLLFMGIGAITGIVQNVVAIVVFGLVCTFSSTILVLGALKNRGDMETLHGQIILGKCCIYVDTSSSFCA